MPHLLRELKLGGVKEIISSIAQKGFHFTIGYNREFEAVFFGVVVCTKPISGISGVGPAISGQAMGIGLGP